MSFDLYVEKILIKNNLASADQIQSAKTAIASNPEDMSLLQMLESLGIVNYKLVQEISKKYEKKMASSQADMGSSTDGFSSSTDDPLAPDSAPDSASSPADEDANAMAITTDTSAIDQYLKFARDNNASDIHINTGYPPTVRRIGSLAALKSPPFTAEQAQALLFSILTPQQRKQALKNKYIEFCYTRGGRYRTCLLKQRCGWNGAFRIIRDQPPSLSELGLPDTLTRLTEYLQGLVLITGPKGCGKSTTLAALVELINQTREEHIVTIEDPIEYVFVPKSSHISQREVVTHTKSFSSALSAALREDPDIIMIGELRDLETTSLAIKASETGHLVLATLHTTSAVGTINQILDTFPPDQQNQVRSMISESIKGIICQKLLPRKDGKGSVLALEIMLNTPAIGNLIRERKLPQVTSMMQMNKKQGMQTMDTALAELVNSGLIDGGEAYFAAINKKPFEQWAPKI